MLYTSDPVQLFTLVSIFILSIGLHEAAHAYAVNYFGDSTPSDQGRLTLNPFAHLDLMGSIMLVMVGFGWGKSVLYNPNNLQSKRFSRLTMEQIIAAAGPLANLGQVVIFAGLLVASTALPASLNWNIQGLQQTLMMGAMLNALLMFLNLTPIPPLDGSKVLRAFLPYKLMQKYDSLEPYGFVLLMALFFLPGVSNVFRIYLNGASAFLVGGLTQLFTL